MNNELRELLEAAAEWLEHLSSQGSAERTVAEDLRALLAKPAAQHQGEPVAYVDYSASGGIRWRPWEHGNLADGAPLFSRPSEQPAPVAVVLPSADDLRSIIRKAARDADLMPSANYYTAAELAAEDVVSEVARLNPPQQ